MKKKQWICPRCGQCEFPPKAYVCPCCGTKLTTEYEIDKTWNDIPSGNMNYDEFEGRK